MRDSLSGFLILSYKGAAVEYNNHCNLQVWHKLSRSDKEAKISYDKKGFKIILNKKCVAKGYWEDKLYWLDILDPSLYAHNRNAATSLHT